MFMSVPPSYLKHIFVLFEDFYSTLILYFPASQDWSNPISMKKEKALSFE